MTDQLHVEPVDDDQVDLMDTEGVEDISPELEVGGERDLTGDGGVIKKLLVKGEGWELPQKDDKVFVHYTGTLEDGTKFDSSVDRGEPFSFTLGAGQVIRGWDTCVGTMKKGEKVQATLRADYAYGESGSPPTIPGGATLLFDIELLSWESRNDLSEEKDGSLMKTITREGDLVVWTRPQDRDLVTVRVSARVVGHEADFIKDLKQEYCIQDGWLCPAISVAVRSMKQGEAVKLKAASRHAFGDKGYEGCPAGSDVEFDIELLHVKAVKDVNAELPGSVTKTIIKEGADYSTPNDDALCTLSWTATLEDGTQFDKVSEAEFRMMRNAFPCDGLEMAVGTMKSGEVADVSISDASCAFGAAGLPDASPPVPGNAKVTYHVELHSFQNGKHSWELSNAEKVERAANFKELGNVAFKAGALSRAARFYSKVEQTLTTDDGFSAEEKAQSKDVQVSASLNLAAVSLKQAKYRDCIAQCNKVLEKRPNMLKALYRRAQAYIETGDFVEAEVDLKAALLEDPGSRDLALAMKRLKAKSRAQSKKDKALFGAMFSKVGNMYKDVPNPPAPSAEPLLEGEDAGPAAMDELDAQENNDDNKGADAGAAPEPATGMAA